MAAILQKFWTKVIWDARAGGNIHDPNTPINGFTLAEAFGKQTTYAGKDVTQDNAMTISAVWACTRILSGVISSLPFKIYERMPNGRRTADDHPYYRATKYPNAYLTRAVYLQRAIIHYLNWGYHLAKINMRPDGVSFDIIHPSLLDSIEVTTRGTLSFKIKDEEGTAKSYPQSQIIYVPNLGDKLIGKGVISNAREDLGLEMAASQYGSKWFNSGGKPQALIHTDEKLDVKQIKDIQESYKVQKANSGDLVMTHGFKYSPMSIPPDDAQFLTTRTFNVSTIARWYGVPPEKLAELDRATYGNLEMNGLAFLADTIAPILSKFEQEYTLKVLDDEKYYFEFDMDGYQRADIRSQAEVDRIYVSTGVRQINEIRQKKNWNPVEYGDNNFMQMNMTTIERIVKGENEKKEPVKEEEPQEPQNDKEDEG